MIRCKNIVALAAGLAASAAVYASEVDAYCELGAARTRVQTELMRSAEGFSQLGDTATRTVVIGVRKSLSRSVQAGLLDQAAQARCVAYRYQAALNGQLSGIQSRAELQALAGKEPLLRQALAQAEAAVQSELSLLAAQNATLADIRAIYELRDRAKLSLAELARRRSLLQAETPGAQEPLAELIGRGAAAEAEAARLGAQATASSAWDFQLAAGVRRNLETSAQGGFAAISATLNFGAGGSDVAAQHVGPLTAKLLQEQREGFHQQFSRARDSVLGVLAATRLAQVGLQERRAVLQGIRDRVAALETADAQRLSRNVGVELLSLEAEILGNDAQIASLAGWLNVNGGSQ